MSATEVVCRHCGERSPVREGTPGVPLPCPACGACFGAAELPLGELPGYVVHEEAGRGGMGVVYRGQERASGRPVAIKVLAENLAGADSFIRRFDHEAEALATLAHPGIVRFIERLGFGGRHLMVMEWVEGQALDRLVRSRGMPCSEAIRVMLELLDILAYAHDRGVIHRDIKPQNVIMTMSGSVKLTDFGLAIVDSAESGKRARITLGHSTLGSSDYMPPEQRRDSSAVDNRVDLYAVGVVLYELLTGELPVGRFRRPSEVSPDCPAAVDEVVLTALEADPARRYPTARRMREELARAANVELEPAAEAATFPPEKASVPMARLAAGGFLMGSDELGGTKRVELGAFRIDLQPVTNSQYRRFVDATGHPEPRYWLDAGRAAVAISPELPVVGVSWHDARAFAAWAGKRLPTEAEWERAARGTDGRRYPWGEEPDVRRCNCRDSGPNRITAAGANPGGASPCGALDMLGNVLEWTSSLDAPYPYDCSDGREDLARGGKRILRGGSWYSRFSELSVWARYPELPDARMPNIGFRCAAGDW